MASGDVIVKVADKETLDRTYANTNAILAAVGEEMTAIRRHAAHTFSMRWE